MFINTAIIFDISINKYITIIKYYWVLLLEIRYKF